MKLTKQRLRQIIKEELRTLTEGLKWPPDHKDPDTWVREINRQAGREDAAVIDRDEKDQTIIYLSKKDYPLERTVMGLLPLEWDINEDTHDASWVIQTNLYPSRRRSDPAGEPRPDEAEGVYQSLQDMILEIDGLQKVIKGISTEHGAFVYVNHYAQKAHAAIAQLLDKVEAATLERDR